MDKQTTLAFVLIGLILIVWLYFNSPTPPPPNKKAQDSTLVAQKKLARKDSLKKAAEAAKKKLAQEKLKKAKEATAKTPPLVKKELKPAKIITVETNLARIELTSRGARLRKCYLKKYDTWYAKEIKDTNDFYDKHVQLINVNKEGGDFNLLFLSKAGALINTKDLNFSSNAKNYYYKISDDDSLVISYTANLGDGRAVKKTFKFFANNYAVKVEIELIHLDDFISGYSYDVMWSDGINFVEDNSVDEARYAMAAAYSGGELVKVDAGKNEKVKKELNGEVNWVSVKDKYFAIIVAADKPSSEGGAYIEGYGTKIPNDGEREYYSTSLKVPFNNTRLQKDDYTVYMGPIDYDVLKKYGRHFEEVFDWGSFLGLTFLIQPISEYFLLPGMKFLHLFISNYGVVLILISILIKIVLYPLTHQSYMSMRKMQLLQPKIQEIKEKYKGDQQKIQKETMKLYQTYGVNPAGGCLPMLLQLPILVALWSLFNVAIELRHQPFIWWITNLSSPDVIYDLGYKIPIIGVDKISGLAILLGITMFFQQKMSVKDPSQKAMVYTMPVLFSLMFMGFPAGLNLYYLMFNILSIIQQYYINHMKTKAGELTPVKNPKKSGFMQRMMQAAEQQSKAQKQSGKSSKRKRR